MNRKITDKLATGVFGLCAAVIAAILAGLFLYILIHGVSEISLHFLTSKSSAIASGGGIRDQLFNSFYILFITMLITIPLGVGGGVFMAEYAPQNKITDFIRTCIEVLSSLPSIVIGMFGMLMFVNLTGWGYTIIGGALALTVFNLPVMVRVTEGALTAVPKELKEASSRFRCIEMAYRQNGADSECDSFDFNRSHSRIRKSIRRSGRIVIYSGTDNAAAEFYGFEPVF